MWKHRHFFAQCSRDTVVLERKVWLVARYRICSGITARLMSVLSFLTAAMQWPVLVHASRAATEAGDKQPLDETDDDSSNQQVPWMKKRQIIPMKKRLLIMQSILCLVRMSMISKVITCSTNSASMRQELTCSVTRVLAISTRVLSTHFNAFFPVCSLVDMFILI